MFQAIAGIVGGETDCISLSGDAATFLTFFEPSDSRYLDEDGIFPRGKRMLIHGYSPESTACLARIAQAGFTVAGPFENDSTTCSTGLKGGARAVRNYNDYGLHAIAKMRCVNDGGVGGSYQEQIDWLYYNDRDRLDSNMQREIDYWDTGLGGLDILEGWENAREESGTSAGNYTVMQYIAEYIQDAIGPSLFVYSPEATSYSTFSSGFTGSVVPWLTLGATQMYVNAHSNEVYGHGGPYHLWCETKELATYDYTEIPLDAGMVYTPSERVADPFLYTGKVWYAGMPDWDYVVDTMHQTFAILIAGAKALCIWRLLRYKSTTHPEAAKYIDGYIDAIEALTTAEAQHAIVWGTFTNSANSTDISVDGFNGNFRCDGQRVQLGTPVYEIDENGDATSVAWTEWPNPEVGNSHADVDAVLQDLPADVTYNRIQNDIYGRGEALAWGSWQLKDTRYILFTYQQLISKNYTYTISGFPTSQIKVTVIASTVDAYEAGDIIDVSSGEFSCKFWGRESLALRVDPADGYCGGGGATKPTITVLPDKQGAVDETVTWNPVISGATSIQWQDSINQGGAWNNITGETSASYTTDALVAGDNGTWFRVQATNAEGTTTSNAAVLTVSTFTPEILTGTCQKNYPYIVTITFNGTVVITNADGITAAGRYLKNKSASGNQFICNVNVSPGTLVTNLTMEFATGAIEVDGVPLVAQDFVCTMINN